MPENKSVYTVDIDDAAFKRFQAVFVKYQEELEKVPKAWRDIGDAQGKAAGATEFEKSISDLEAHIKKLKGSFEGSGSGLDKADLSAQRFGRTIKGVSGSFSEIAKFTAGIGLGLAGFGALGIGAPLWLMDRLGQSAMNSQRNALQTGNQPGSMKAFDNAFQQIGVGDQQINAIATGKMDAATVARWSAATNIPAAQLENMQPSDLAIELMKSQRRLVGSQPAYLRNQLNAAYGFTDAGLGGLTGNAIDNASPQQFQKMLSQYQANSKTLDSELTPGALQSWSNFTTTLGASVQKLEGVALNDGAPLAGAFANLSTGLADLAASVFGAPSMQKNIQGIAKSINDFAASLPDGVKNFKAGVAFIEGNEPHSSKWSWGYYGHPQHPQPKEPPDYDKGSWRQIQGWGKEFLSYFDRMSQPAPSTSTPPNTSPINNFQNSASAPASLPAPVPPASATPPASNFLRLPPASAAPSPAPAPAPASGFQNVLSAQPPAPAIPIQPGQQGGAAALWNGAKGIWDGIFGSGAGQQIQTRLNANASSGIMGFLFGTAAASTAPRIQNQAFYEGADGSSPGGVQNASYTVNPPQTAGFGPQNGDFNPFAGASALSGKWSSLDAGYGLPSGFLEAVEQQESGGNPMAVSPKGAEGAFQFTPSTAAQFGLGNPFDEGQSAQAAAKDFQQLLRQFKGNIQEALAAYNWGAANVTQAAQKYGANWLAQAPQETQNYVAKITAQLAGHSMQQAQGGTRIIINNNTGGSAIVTTASINA